MARTHEQIRQEAASVLACLLLTLVAVDSQISLFINLLPTGQQRNAVTDANINMHIIDERLRLLLKELTK